MEVGKNRITVAIKHDKFLELASLHWACIFLGSASLPVQVAGCRADRSPVLWLQSALWWQKGRGGCLRKSLQSTQEQGAQKIGHQPCKAWASHAEHLLGGLESTCVRRGHWSWSAFPGVLFPSHMTFRVGSCKPASSLTLQVSLTGSCTSSYRVTWSLNQAAP